MITADYRAWSIKNKKMYYSANAENVFVLDRDGWELCTWGGVEGADSKKGDVLMQFTGLEDKNGKKIYADDVVLAQSGEVYMGCREYSKKIHIKDFIGDVYILSNCDDLFIIGNIWENPELMEEI